MVHGEANANIFRSGPIGAGGFSPSTDEYQAIYDQFTVTPDDADAEAQDTFVSALVDGGIWSEADRMFVLASHAVAPDSLLDWIHPTGTGATVYNAAPLVLKQGYTGNGSSYYIDTNFNPTTQGVKYTLSNASIMSYSRTAGTESSGTSIGANSGGRAGTQHNISASNYSGNWSNTTSSTPGVVGQGLGDGMAGWDRAISTEAIAYNNGANPRTTVTNSVAMPNETFEILCMANGGLHTWHTSRQISFVFLGGTLGATKQLALYNAFQALMTHYGTQV